MPEKPEWLPLGASDAWDSIIADLEAAKIPLQRIDASGIGFFVLCIHQAATAAATGDAKLAARLNRDAIVWANAIGATPAARARLGIKPEAVQKKSKWDRLG